MAFSTSTAARWTILSSSAGTPSGLCRPSALGINTLRTGFARYAPRFSLSARSWRFLSTLRRCSCEQLRMTRGRCGSLLHIRMTFAFTTPRRFSRRTGELEMPVIIEIPTAFRRFTKGAPKVDCSAATVAEALNELTARFPDLSRHVRDDQGQIRQFLNVYLNEEDIRR